MCHRLCVEGQEYGAKVEQYTFSRPVDTVLEIHTHLQQELFILMLLLRTNIVTFIDRYQSR